MNERILWMPLISVILSDLTTRVLTQKHYRMYLLFINICHNILILCHSDLKAFFVLGLLFLCVCVCCFLFCCNRGMEGSELSPIPHLPVLWSHKHSVWLPCCTLFDWWNAGWCESDSRHKHCVCLIKMVIKNRSHFEGFDSKKLPDLVKKVVQLVNKIVSNCFLTFLWWTVSFNTKTQVSTLVCSFNYMLQLTVFTV